MTADRALLEAAAKVRAHAYAPYSQFLVGSAVRTRDGVVFAGVNVENASYGVTICAEVAALTAAATAGKFAEIEAIAVVGGEGEPLTPCGRCRQLIREAADLSGIDIAVHCANADLSKTITLPISALLPHAFGAKDLRSD